MPVVSCLNCDFCDWYDFFILSSESRIYKIKVFHGLTYRSSGTGSVLNQTDIQNPCHPFIRFIRDSDNYLEL